MNIAPTSLRMGPNGRRAPTTVNSDRESDEEMEDINLLDVVKCFHTSLKNIQDLRRKYDIAFYQLNNLDLDLMQIYQ